MSENFWTIVVVAVAVLLIIYILRRTLKRVKVKGPWIEGEVETHEPESASRASTEPIRRAGINISDVNQEGSGNLIDVGRADVNIERIKQKDRNQIIARPDQSNQEEK